MRQRVIIFMLGTEPRKAQYYLADAPVDHRPVEATLAPVALVKLQKQLGIADYPDKAIVLVTAKAREREQEVRDAFVIDNVRIPVEFIDIPLGSNRTELRQIIERLLAGIPDNCELVIDVTHGLRASPFVFSLAVQYLSLVNPSVAVKEMYYGMSSQTEHPGPIVNLSPFLDMLEWVYVMRVFRDTLLPTRLMQKIRSSADGAQDDEPSRRLLSRLELFSVATEAALPVEMARTAAALCDELKRGLPERLKGSIPLGERLFRALEDVASEFIPASGDVPEELDDAELERQAKVIDKLLQHGRVVQALGLMYEWCTLKVLRHNSNNLKDWRDKSEQEAAKKRLAMGQWSNEGLREKVEKIGYLRNNLHHYAQRDARDVRLDRLYKDAEELWNSVKNGRDKDWVIRFDDSPKPPKRLTRTLGDELRRAQRSQRR